MKREHSATQRSSAGPMTAPALLHQSAYLAGEWIQGTAKPIDVHNPADGSLVGSVPDLGAEHMRQAIDRAQDALRAWKALLPRQRADILMAWHSQILRHKRELATLMMLEQGKPLADAGGEIEYAASFVRWFAEEANRVYGEVIPSHLPHRKMFVQREALGVVGLVTPWNFPSAMLTRKAAAALAAGCTAIAIPSLETPFSALALADLAAAAGVPSGVLSVLTGDPKVLVGELCRSEKVRGLSFTGSTAIGRLLAEQCAPTLKRLSMELGGHAPFIVFSDADISKAAEMAVAAKFQTSGQDCLAANRIFVQRDVLGPFTERFVALTRTLKVGAGYEEGVDVGPLINRQTFAKSAEHVADAVAKGARVLEGGGSHPRGGLFFSPTVLTGVEPQMKIMQEETFGPVAPIVPFDSEEEVIRAANATEYGLAAYVFTRDIARAYRVSDALEYGMVAINTVQMTGAPIPFGGVKQSGLGREGSRHGIEEYTELKYVCVDLTPASITSEEIEI